MYHEGPVFDSEVARTIKVVYELLSRFEGNLEVEEIDGLDSEDFLRFCTLPAFRAMKELNHQAVKTNADLRAGNSESLAGFWLVSQGYSGVKISFESAFLGKFEYDAIGVKDGECLVVEVKSGSLVDSERQRQISRLAHKVEYLSERKPDLKRALGCEIEIDKVSGLFVFLGDLGNFVSAETHIRLSTYDEFVSALKTVGLPDRIVGLLDRSNIIHSMQPGEFMHDPFFVGLEDSSIEG